MNSSSKLLPMLTGAVTFLISVASTMPALSQPYHPAKLSHDTPMHLLLNLTSVQQIQIEQILQNERLQINTTLPNKQTTQLQHWVKLNAVLTLERQYLQPLKPQLLTPRQP